MSNIACLFTTRAFTTLVCLSMNSLAVCAALPVPERGFVSTRPAETWEEGLLSGNGTLGANVLSRPLQERVIFTHERLFLPQRPPVVPPDSSSSLPRIRRLIEAGRYKEATQLAFDLSGQESFLYPDPFVPAFDLTIGMEPEGEIRGYARSVDFQTGEAAVHWEDARGVFERRLFVSRTDHVAVLSIRSSQPGTISCRLRLEPRQPSEQLDPEQVARSREVFNASVSNIVSQADRLGLTYRNTFTKAYPGSIQALEGVARIASQGGTRTVEGPDTLAIQNADEVLILVDIRLRDNRSESRLDELKSALASISLDYAELLARHAKRHGELFNRMRLDIGGDSDHQRSTEQLLASSTDEHPNRALIEKQFDAGRYNIISCTGELPPTLQGCWGGTYVPGWASDFTHNGNVPSAIAANMMGNMPELMPAYTSYIESLVPDLQINARHMFGARGIVLPSRSTTNGFNNALAPNFAGGFWVAGAGWAAHFFYDYYLYTGDRDFLAQHALPFMEKAAYFFEDYLYEGPDGKLLFSPTQSPENTPGNSNSQGSFNATMDVAVAKELLRNVISASHELNRNADKIAHWQQMLNKMPEYMIDDEGFIKEWLTPRLENNDNHRHSSQLYPLFDGLPQEIAASPELRAAFRQTIEYKLDRHWNNNQRGFMSFGLVQLGQAAASLGESELAYRCLRHLTNRFWLNNLASMHNHRSLFNMDISGGMPAVVIKMLVASAPGRIQLLPALPADWPSGQIEGVLCRGMIEVESLRWESRQVDVRLRSGKAQTVLVGLPSPIDQISVTHGAASVTVGHHDNERTLTLPANQSVALHIELQQPSGAQ